MVGKKRKREDSELSGLELLPPEVLNNVFCFLDYDDLIKVACASSFMLFNARHRLRIESVKWKTFHLFKNHTIGLKFNGDVAACGNNLRGFVGAGDDVDVQRTPTMILQLKNITEIAASSMHAVFLKADGTLEVCGANENGRLGLGDASRTSKRCPVPIGYLKEVKKVIANEEVTFVLFANATVASCGNNRYGKLGHGVLDQDHVTYFAIIQDLVDVKNIVVGEGSTFFLMNDTSVKACGLNTSYQLGMGDFTTRYTITQIPDLSGVVDIIPTRWRTYFLMNDDTVKFCGTRNTGSDHPTKPVVIDGLSHVKQVVAKNDHALFLLKDGSVAVFGSNIAGQIGLGDKPFESQIVLLAGVLHVREIVALNSHTFFLLQDGQVMACGVMEYGQLGLGVLPPQKTPVLVPGLKNIKKIFASERHTLCLTYDNKAFGFGSNEYGQLGLGDVKMQLTPIELAAFNIAPARVVKAANTMKI